MATDVGQMPAHQVDPPATPVGRNGVANGVASFTSLDPAVSSYLDYLPAPFHEDPFVGRFLLIFETILGSIEGTVSDQMTHDPITVGRNASNGEAASLMIHGGFRHVPVVEDDRLVGIVSIRDLLRLPNESPAGV